MKALTISLCVSFLLHTGLLMANYSPKKAMHVAFDCSEILVAQDSFQNMSHIGGGSGWNGDWVPVDVDSWALDPGSYQFVVEDAGVYALHLKAGWKADRAIDLSGVDSAQICFDYRRTGWNGPWEATGDSVFFRYHNGTQWVTAWQLTGSGSDANYTTVCVNLPVTADSIRFVGATDGYLDDVNITNVTITGCEALPPMCTVPSAITLTQIPATCTGSTANNNGTITLTAVTNATHFGLSALNASSYNGPAYSAATAITLPQTLQTSVSNTGGTYILRLYNASNGCYRDETVYVYPVYCADPCVNTVGGQVWLDQNANGIKEVSETFGQKDIVVHAYDCNGQLVGTDSTDYYGNWHLDGSFSYPLRVEFSGISAFRASSFLANDSKSSIQFLPTAGCNYHLGLFSPASYCQTNPELGVNCYMNGNNSSGSSGAGDVLVKFHYDDTGFSPAPTHIGFAMEAGTTWGLAYQKETKKLFSSAYLKRHAGFGPLGTGGIYITDIVTGTTTGFVDLATLGINTGADPHINLPSDRTAPSQDSLAFHEIGKRAFGDMDISDDGKYLFLVNLFDRSLHRIFINNPASIPSVADIATFSIPNPCPDNDNRPFAVKYHQGKVYVGVVCSGETSQSRADLQASVYIVDPVTGVFDAHPVLSFPLDYTRGRTWRPTNASNLWYPWLNDWTDVFVDGSNGVVTYPQPMLTDIEFDEDGSMILGLRDRIGDQLGVYNYYPDGSLMGAETVAGGDILRAAPHASQTRWLLEYGGRVGSLNSGTPNGQGIGGSEFYQGDFYIGGEPIYGHLETSLGGLALLPGSNEIAMTAVDAAPDSYGFQGYNSAGIRYLSNIDGSLSDGYIVYDSDSSPGTFQKSGGLGDVELFCNAAPIQIGNLVWFDANGNGVQDACEDPLSGVLVNLYKMDAGATTLVAGTLTDANGNYTFSDREEYGGFDTLQMDKMYFVVIGEGGQFNTTNGQLTLGGVQYQLTSRNTGEGTNPDLNDSDAFVYTPAGKPFTGYPVDTITVGAPGTVNHTLDFGLRCIAPTNVTLTQITATCTGPIANNDGIITLTTATNGTHVGVSSLNAGSYDGPDFASATAISLPQLVQSMVPNTGGTYIVRVYNGSDGCYTDETVTVSAVTCSCPTMNCGAGTIQKL